MANSFNAKQFLNTLTDQPGVYSMYDAYGTVIYVGKAKNLKKRLISYFRVRAISRKTEVLVKSIHHIDVTITRTETEALLLEHNYIKLHQPRYNVLLRDDKSYPYIFLSQDKHPRITIHRGARYEKGSYFGPFPNSYVLKRTLSLLQKLFLIRQCANSLYKNRSRPCLQYQLNLCLGPCVSGLVSDEEYEQQVEYTRLFLSGKNQEVLNQLVQQMELDSRMLNFEKAARTYDQIKIVRRATEKQFVSDNGDDLDVISVSFNNGIACIHVLFIRHGKVLDSHSYFPKVPIDTELAELVQTFIGQFYLQSFHIWSLPREILLDFVLPEKKILVELLSKQAGRKINIQTQPRGKRANYLKLARINATTALMTKLTQYSTVHKRLESLAKLLRIKVINRIECFDISHTMGEQTIASCVVFDNDGPVRNEYRRYNIGNTPPGNDYAAIGQVLRRRYGKLLEEKKIPNVVIIDGGKGQLGVAKAVFEQLHVPWDKSRVVILGIAKGANRKASLDRLFLQPYGTGITLSPDSPALHVIQHIRDDAHSHAINGHRNKLTKVKNTSSLELIKGIGPHRRQLLLKYMGGMQLLCNSSAEEIARVPGISNILAEKIFNALKC